MQWFSEFMVQAFFYFGKIFYKIGGFLSIAVVALLVWGLFVLWRSRMKTLSGGIILVLSLPFLWFASAFVYETLNSFTHHYRLTVEVETPEGLKSGSNVIQVTVTSKSDLVLQSGGVYSGVKGEAIFIDLGNGKNVVATLGFGPNGADTDRLSTLAAEVLKRYEAFWYKKAPDWTEKAELYGELIPTLVTFSNPADPATARVVRPDEFEMVFGPGYRFKGAWLEMTTDDVVWQRIEEKLLWLNHMERYRRDPNNPFTSTLPFGSLRFVRRH
jgi:hypothetical protein